MTPSMTQHITLDEVKDACRKFYHEGRLLAQNTELTKKAGYQRIINGVDYRCAIGAVLLDEMLEEIHLRGLNCKSLTYLFSMGYITACHTEEESLIKIFVYHDIWLSSYYKEIFEKNFRNLIGIV